MKKPDKPALEEIEVQWLLEGIYLHFGNDFRDDAPASVEKARVKR
jgi:hypothetical protein